MRNFKVLKCDDDAYTIGHRSHWYDKWVPCKINIIRHLHGEDNEKLQQVFPYFYVYESKYIRESAIEYNWLHTISKALEKCKYDNNAILFFDGAKQKVHIKNKHDLAVWERECSDEKLNIVYIRDSEAD